MPKKKNHSSKVAPSPNNKQQIGGNSNKFWQNKTMANIILAIEI
jgi:hypothetical protein